MAVPQFKEIRKAYGFDDVAISPGVVTINPDQVNREFSINGMTMPMPVLASAMDAIVSPSFAVEFDKRGGLAVMNLEGLQTRYDNPPEVLDRISSASNEDATTVMQDAYAAPIKENLVGDRIREIKSKGAKCAVSITPANTKRLAPLAEEAGADVIVV